MSSQLEKFHVQVREYEQLIAPTACPACGEDHFFHLTGDKPPSITFTNTALVHGVFSIEYNCSLLTRFSLAPDESFTITGDELEELIVEGALLGAIFVSVHWILLPRETSLRREAFEKELLTFLDYLGCPEPEGVVSQISEDIQTIFSRDKRPLFHLMYANGAMMAELVQRKERFGEMLGRDLSSELRALAEILERIFVTRNPSPASSNKFDA